MKRITLRLPDDLHNQIENLAAQENRSLNAEIVRAIKRHLLIAHALETRQRIDAGLEKTVSHDELMRKIQEKQEEERAKEKGGNDG